MRQCQYPGYWVSPVPLGHAAVVDHEEVDLELVGAGAGDGVVLRPYELHHLHAAALALLGGRHRGLTSRTPCISATPCTALSHLLGVCPVPGVVAPRVIPGVTLETVDCVPSCK